MNPLSKGADHDTNSTSHEEDTLEATRLMYLKQIEVREHQIEKRRALLTLQSKMDTQNQILESLDTQIHDKTVLDLGSDSDSDDSNTSMKFTPPVSNETPVTKTHSDRSNVPNVTTNDDIPPVTDLQDHEAVLSPEAQHPPMRSQSVSPLTTFPFIEKTPSRDDPQDEETLNALEVASPQVSPVVDLQLDTQETRAGPSVRVMIVGLTNNEQFAKAVVHRGPNSFIKQTLKGNRPVRDDVVADTLRMMHLDKMYRHISFKFVSSSYFAGGKCASNMIKKKDDYNIIYMDHYNDRAGTQLKVVFL